MSGKITKHAYEALVKEDIDWLIANTTDSLERKHIISVMQHSVAFFYPPASQQPTHDEHDEHAEMLRQGGI